MGIKKRIKYKKKSKKIKKKSFWLKCFILFDSLNSHWGYRIFLLSFTAILLIYIFNPVKVCYLLFDAPSVIEYNITIIDKKYITIVESCKNDIITKHLEGQEEVCEVRQFPLPEDINYANLRNMYIINTMDHVKFYELLFRFRSSSIIFFHKVTSRSPFLSQWDLIEIFKYNAYTNSIKIELVLIAKNETYDFSTKIVLAGEILKNWNTGVSDNETVQDVLLSYLKSENDEIS